MTVTANDTIEQYTIAGVGPYAFSFRIFNDTDLQVTALSTASPAVPVTLGYLSQYTVTGANESDGGSITLTGGAQTTYAGYTLDIRSNTPQTQPTSIRNQARFLPEIHEDAFDDLSRQVQDLNRKVRASLRYPDTLNVDAVMSPLSSWVSKYVTVNAAGVLEPATLTSSGAITQSIVSGLLYPQSALESATSTTPATYIYPYGDPRRSTLYTNAGWLNYGDSPTFISTTSFSIPSDVTARYPTQRYVQMINNGAGAVVGRITQAVFGSGKTTFTIASETGNVPNPIVGVSLAMSMLADGPTGVAYDQNVLPTAPFVWNKSNGTAAVSRFCVFAGTSGLGSDVGLAVVVLQNSYGSFPYISGGPSGRQAILHTGVSAPISIGVFDVCKATFTAGNNPTHLYTDVNVINVQSGATATNLIVDSNVGAARVAMKQSGTEKGFFAVTASEVLLGTNSAIDVSIVYNGSRVITFSGATTTGAATPTLGTNKPGAGSSVAEWMPVKNAGGTQRYIPLWS